MFNINLFANRFVKRWVICTNRVNLLLVSSDPQQQEWKLRQIPTYMHVLLYSLQLAFQPPPPSRRLTRTTLQLCTTLMIFTAWAAETAIGFQLTCNEGINLQLRKTEGCSGCSIVCHICQETQSLIDL